MLFYLGRGRGLKYHPHNTYKYRKKKKASLSGKTQNIQNKCRKRTRKLEDYSKRTQNPNNRNSGKRTGFFSMEELRLTLAFSTIIIAEWAPTMQKVTSDFLKHSHSIISLRGSNCAQVFWDTLLLTDIKSEPQHKEWGGFYSHQYGSAEFHKVGLNLSFHRSHCLHQQKSTRASESTLFLLAPKPEPSPLLSVLNLWGDKYR